MSDLTDAMAIAKNSDGFLEGNGIIILILFFLIFGFGSNGFGGNSNALTQAEMQVDLYNQTTDRNLSDIRTAQCETNNLIQTNSAVTNGNIAEAKYENLLQFKDLSNQMCQCCGDMKATIIEENSKTRDLIQANYISGLQSALQDEKQANAIMTSNNNLLSTMGRWYANQPYCSCNCNNYLV